MNSRIDLSDLRPFMLGCMLAATLAIAGCGGHSIQTTSGKAYLEKHNVASQTPVSLDSESPRGARFDEVLRQVASIEPTLTFPARIGIVKVDNGGTPQPFYPEEIEAWSEMATGLGGDYGTFMPINPLIFEEALSAASNTGLLVHATGLERIRLAAARQHLDVVIAYETSSQATRKANPLAFGDLTIIGAFVLPSRKIESEGYAAGIILDPISGYPYGQVEAAAEDSAHTTWVNKSEKKVDVQRNTEIGASVALAEETGKALQKLRLALAEQRSAAIEK